MFLSTETSTIIAKLKVEVLNSSELKITILMSVVPTKINLKNIFLCASSSNSKVFTPDHS